MRVGVLVACTQERDAGPPSDLDTSVVSGRSTASRHSVARLGGSLVHSSTNGGVVSCPFPDEWQYGSVPDSITNEDELD